MRPSTVSRTVFAIAALFIPSYAQAQTAPAEMPRASIFASGVLSAPANTTAPTFTPDGGTVYFELRHDGRREIFQAQRTPTGWTNPVVLPFETGWTYLEPILASDGSYLVFASNRPAQGSAPLDGMWGGQNHPARGGALWRSDKTSTGWSAPYRLPSSINEGTAVFEPALTADGSLYFMRPGDDGNFHLFRAQRSGSAFEPAEQLPFSKAGVTDVDATVAPDDSYVIFTSNRASHANLELFIAFRHDGHWDVPVRFPQSINAGDSITEPRLSPDQKTLYFTRDLVIWSLPIEKLLSDLRTRPVVR